MTIFHKLTVSENSYITNNRQPYGRISVSKDNLSKVIDFAYEMCFGDGHHRHHRTGGTANRKAGEQFCNTFQGKLAEICLRNLLISQGVQCGEPDFDVYGEGVWDDTDLVVNGTSISVKSAAHFSNLLLLESHDYNENGEYLPNKAIGATASYDYYVLVRVSPDVKSLFRKKRWMYSNDIAKEDIMELIMSESWSFDIAGYISHEEFVSVIRNRNIIPKGALLNGKIPMDASNYYVQSGDMHRINEFIEQLK